MSSRSPELTPPANINRTNIFPSLLPATPTSGRNDSSAYSSEYQTKIAEQREKYESKLAEDTTIFGELMFNQTLNTNTKSNFNESSSKPNNLEGLKICSVRSLSDKSLMYNENTNGSNNTIQSNENDNNDNDDDDGNGGDDDNNDAITEINDEDSSLDKDVRDLILQTAAPEYNRTIFGIAKQKSGHKKHNSHTTNNKDTVTNRFLRMSQHHRNGDRRRGRPPAKIFTSNIDEKKKSKIFNYREQCDKTYRSTFRKDNNPYKEHYQQQQQSAADSKPQSESMDINDEIMSDDDEQMVVTPHTDEVEQEEVDVTAEDEEIIKNNKKKSNTPKNIDTFDESDIPSVIINTTSFKEKNCKISAIINIDSDSDDANDDDNGFEINTMETDSTIPNQQHTKSLAHSNNLTSTATATASATATVTATATATTKISSTATTPAVAAPSTSGINSGGGGGSSSRRKTVHKPLLDHSNVIFEENRAKMLKESKIQIDLVKSAENPNEDLMKKIAFLRCCVSYMMDEFNRKPIQFQRGMTLNHLKAAYAIRKDGKK